MDASRSPESGLVTKVTRTYGRRKDTSGGTLENAIAINISSISATLQRNQPSSATDVQPDSNSEDGLSDTDDAFGFGWKRKLAQIDQVFDDEEGLNPTEGDGDTTLHIDSASPATGKLHDNDSGDGYDALFSGSLPMLTSSSQTRCISPSPVAPKRGTKQRVVMDSDESENDAKASNRHSSPTSPQYLHSINTPKLGSSPTPPTSDASIQPSLLKRDSSILLRENEEDKAEDHPEVRKGKKGKSKEVTRKKKVSNEEWKCLGQYS